MAGRTKGRASVIARIKEFREKREQAKELADEVKDILQPELIAAMKFLDPKNVGVVWDESDKSKGTAYVQQNEPSEYWDEEAIQDYIKSKTKLKKSVMVQVLSMQKWEAEVAAGNVPAKIAEKLKKTGTTPAPFIRFGKAGNGSIHG